jgi:hypothetical protein
MFKKFISELKGFILKLRVCLLSAYVNTHQTCALRVMNNSKKLV